MSQAIMVVPIGMTSASLEASNVPENDYPAWVSGTNYAVGDRRIRTTTHKVYEDLIGGASTVAPENDPTRWAVVGSTNRWRAFDASVGQSVSQSGTITYTIRAASKATAIAFVGLVAVSVRVVVKDASAVVLSDETRNLVDTSGITDWELYFTYETETDPEQVFTGLPLYAGYSVEITIDAGGGAAEVGEIIIGRAVVLGTIESGARSGFTDYSARNVDDYGNVTLIRRTFARKAEWPIIFPTRSNRRLQRELENARGTICYFHPGDGMTDFYLGVLGTADEFFPELAAGGTTFATLSLTGVA
jgi:hypothetical protein